MTPEQLAALDVARRLAAAGIPVFVAGADPTSTTGFVLPTGWQRTPANPRVVDAWRPGMALAMICGHGLDLLDVDPRSGGDPAALNGATPVSYASAITPSGGVHSFIRSLGVHSRNGVLPGIDVKAGDPAGQGRGFAFIAPTVRRSKVTGEPVAYRWVSPPDLARLAASGDDRSGAALAALIETVRVGAGAAPDAQDFMRTGPWAELEAGTVFRQGRNQGVARLAQALRGRGGWRLSDALAYMREVVWPRIDQEQGGHPFTLAEFETTITAQWRQYPDGDEQRATVAAIPPTPGGPVPNPARYFAKGGGLLAATLAGDVGALGPLAIGGDHITWQYESGAWRPAKYVVRDRVAWLMGERYKRYMASTAEDIIVGRVPTITCEPVESLINFTNGLLDWRTGELLPHTPEVPSTVQLPVVYAPDATCPAFARFLAEVVPLDMIPVVWELIGYLMYSGNPLHKAVMLTGHGRNGKGTLLRVVTALLGRTNVTSVSLHDLVNTRFTTASLFGKLANIAGDIDAGYLENTATFKQITGGDQISAEHKGRDRFDFTPWAVPVFSANKIPASADTTVGYLSRWLVVPFPHDFTGREDRHLDGRLQQPAELRGIAAAGIAALSRLLERGDFQVTESGARARDEFVRRVDQVRTWLAECTQAEPDTWSARTEMYDAYKRWGDRDGYRPVRAGEFYDRLEAAGCVPATIRGNRGFRDVRIIDPGYPRMPGMAPAPPAPPAPTVTSANTPQGAQGAENLNSCQAQGAEGAEISNSCQAGAPEVDQGCSSTPAEPAPLINNPENDLRGAGEPAPLIKSLSTSENSEKTLGLLIKGAGIPHPPVRARTRRGGYQDPAPSAPLINNGSPAGNSGDKRAQAILEAAGGTVALPAVVERSGAITVLSVAEAGANVADLIVRTGGALTVDVEHTGYPVGHAQHRLKTVQLGDQDVAVVFDVTDPEQAEVTRTALAAAPRLHAHSATADLVPLEAAGLVDESAWARMYDTVIPAKLADPASTGSDPGLKQLAAAVLGDQAVAPAMDAARAALFKAGKWLTETTASTPLERSGWAQVDAGCATMVRYAASDVLDTAALALRLPAAPAEVIERERAVQRITARVAHRGLRIDGDRVLLLIADHNAARARASANVKAHDIDNPGSDRQVAAALTMRGVTLPHTKPSARHPGGQPSVAAGVLEKFRGTPGPAGELVAAVLDYRHHETVLSTFLEPYRQLVVHGDGRARPTVYTLGTDTGRMSCVRPNLQQLPRTGGVRACITADPGHLLISADFSGVELRVAAALSGDPNLRRMIAQGVDLHWEIARQVWGPEATKADRYAAKRIVFGRLYGGGVPTLARQANVSESVAASAVEVLDATTPGLAGWSRMIRDAIKRGATRFPTYGGRTIHFPPDYPHKGPNYAIQGTARELLVDALLRWEATRWGGGVVLPVHDEIVAVVPESDAEEATLALVECMTAELLGVPIVAEASKPAYAWQDSV